MKFLKRVDFEELNRIRQYPKESSLGQPSTRNCACLLIGFAMKKENYCHVVIMHRTRDFAAVAGTALGRWFTCRTRIENSVPGLVRSGSDL